MNWLTDSHVIIPAGAMLIGLAVQLYCAYRLWAAYTAAVVLLRRECTESRDTHPRETRIGTRAAYPRVDHPGSADHPWLGWINERITAAKNNNGLLPTRVESLTELEYWMASLPAYFVLHRGAILAPLIGVLITAIGFATLRLPDLKELGTEELVPALAPVIYGMFCGTSLAISNQILLLIVEYEEERVRTAGRHHLDRLLNQPAVRDATWRQSVEGHIQRLSETLSETMQTGREVAKAGQATAESFQRTTESLQSRFGKVVETLSEAASSIVQPLAGLQAAVLGMQKLDTAWQDSAQTFKAATAERIKADADFLTKRDKTEMQLAQATAALTEVTNMFAERSSAAMTESTRLISTSRHEFDSRHSELIAVVQSLVTPIADLSDRLLATNESLLSTIQSLHSMGAEWNGVLATIDSAAQQLSQTAVGPVTQASSDLADAARRLRTTGEATDSVMSALATSLSSYHETSQHLASATRDLSAHVGTELRVAVEGLSRGAARTADLLPGLAEQSHELAETLSTTSQELANTTRAALAHSQVSLPALAALHEDLMRQLRDSAEAQMTTALGAGNTTELLHEAATALHALLAQLPAAIREQTHLQPALQQMTMAATDAAELIQAQGAAFANTVQQLNPAFVGVIEAVPNLHRATSEVTNILTETIRPTLASLEELRSSIRLLCEAAHAMSQSGLTARNAELMLDLLQKLNSEREPASKGISGRIKRWFGSRNGSEDE